MSKNILGIGLVLTILVGGAYWYFSRDTYTDEAITSFEECAQYYPVMESYPAQCTTKGGKHFVQNIGNELEKSSLITIDSPRPTAPVSSPLTISGKARGYWFFEASFPVELQDGNGLVLARGIAQAGSDWMTEDFVPYSVTLTFSKPATKGGVLILHKDNPSGDPAREDSLIVPVVF